MSASDLLARLPRFRFGSLRQRISLLYGALFAAVLTVMMILVSAGIERFGEANASRDLAANARVFDEILDLRARQMQGSADVLARDFGFREAVATGDQPTVASALRSLRDRSRTSAAFVIGLDGTMVTDGTQGLPDAEALWYPLDEGQDKGIINVNGTMALAAASPIEAPALAGWLVLAQPLNQAEMTRLSDLAAVEIEGFVRSQAALGSEFTDIPLGEVVERGGASRELYHVSEVPALQQDLSPRLVLRHSLGDALLEYGGLKILLVLVSIAGLALAIILGMRVSRGITGPLSRLDEAVRRFADGDGHVDVPETHDEVGRLGGSFNRMVAAIAEREREIIHVGLHDGLTNLPNRKLFVEQLGQALARREDGERILVAYCDLDDFKVINDAYGHPAGDALLCALAEHLRDDLRDAQIARLGGDEFAVLIRVRDPKRDLLPIAKEIQNSLVRTVEIPGHKIENSASIGIAVAPGDGESGVELLKHADLALYRAKKGGKSDFHFFEPSLDEQARRRREMELDLRLAIKHGHFELHYQPLYNLPEDKLNGFEALIRWNHPEQGMISPAEFIPLAEDTGLIVQIGEWVVREACRAAACWPESMSVAVNISPKQFAAPGLASTIMQALTNSGLPPSRLELEITESIFIADVEKTLSTLHTLRDLGVRIALDDFGTGYSSLSYLRSFPFDKVKIDQSFVRDLNDKGNNAHAVIRAITTLADALGMETLAEGVESSEQFDILRAEGCRYVQGYLVSKPLPADQIAKLWGKNDLLRKLRAA